MKTYNSLMTVFIIVVLLYSCFPTKESDDMIKYISAKFDKYKTELEKIVAWVESKNIYSEYCMDIDS